mgnify:FL=1
MPNKKHKAQGNTVDQIPIQDMNGNFVALGHPGFLRRIAKDGGGFFQKSLVSTQTNFVLSKPATPVNYPELLPFLKDNNVNQQGQLDTSISASSATATTPGTQKFNSNAAEPLLNPEEQLRKYGEQLKNLPVEMRNKLIYGDITDSSKTYTSGTVSSESIVSDSVVAKVSYLPKKESKVFSEAEQKAYFAEFNARHRYLQNINVEVLKSNMGETKYTITADYRGEITVYQYFKCHIRCDLTLFEYSDNLILQNGEWESIHVEKWLGTYYAYYTEWEDVVDKSQDGSDNRVMHPENRKELEKNWQMSYHNLPIEAINFMMNFNPQGLTDKTYKSDS